MLANDCDDHKCRRTANIYRTILDKYNDTRTIRIKGKNVDDLDLEKTANLIQQANARASKINLRGLFKNLRKTR
jgi:tRNA pseudouridine-54 N-methylase